MAQKNGWITDVRDTAAIVYGPHGPRIVVVLTYRPGLDAARRAFAALTGGYFLWCFACLCVFLETEASVRIGGAFGGGIARPGRGVLRRPA